MGGWAIAIHGGAGVDPALPLHRQEEAKEIISHCLRLGSSALSSGLPSIDVVELVVRELESNPFFNAGKGSALTAKGTVEMEASIMDGEFGRCGAVSGLTTVKNPISLARLVMDRSPHSYLAFSGAEEFARQQGVETVDDPEYFITDDNRSILKIAKEAGAIVFDYYRNPVPPPMKSGHGIDDLAAMQTMINGLPISIYTPETVGCVAVDMQGRCAAATSTGGLVNKMTGRIGDSPLIGAGTYASKLCAVSCTGEGEAIIRATVARDVSAVMEYKGVGLKEAVEYVIKEKLEEGKGGLIAISDDGKAVCGFNCVGMFRGLATEDGLFQVAIW